MKIRNEIDKIIKDNLLNQINLNSTRPNTIPKNRIIIKQLIDKYKMFNKKDILYIAVNKNNKKLFKNFLCECGKLKHCYLHYCSRKCKYFIKHMVNESEKTCLKKYGVKNIGMLPEHKDKIIATSRKKYGVDFYTQTKECHIKTENTNMKKYGVRISSQSDIVKQHIKEYFNKKFGTNSYVETDEFNKKRSKTMINKYGTDCPLQILKSKIKAQKTCLKRYGVKSYLSSNKINNTRNSKEIQQKRYETLIKNKTMRSSKIEKECYNILLKKINNSIRWYKSDEYPFACDYYIPILNCYIEGHFGWRHGGEPFDPNNIKHIEKLNLWKERSKKLNFKGKQCKAYLNAIYQWTELDPKKLKNARKNKLNFYAVYTKDQFINLINSL